MTVDTQDPFYRLAHEMVVESTNQAFQMMLGGIPTHFETREVPESISDEAYDHMGTITAEGEKSLTLSLGLSENQVRTLGQIMMGQPVEDESILVGCHQELLNIILGGTIGALSQISPLKLNVPNMTRNSVHSFDSEREEGQVLRFSSDTLDLDLLLKIRVSPE